MAIVGKAPREADALVVAVADAQIMLRRGFDAELLRDVVDALRESR